MDQLTKYFANYTIGPDAYQLVPTICAPYGSRALLIGGKTALEKAETRLLSSLSRDGRITVTDTLIYGQECTVETIHKIAAHIGAGNADMVFAMGGGRAVDTAKGVADLLKLPVFTFPTIPSNCASMSALSVTYHEDGSFDRFLFFERPAIHCFIDTAILAASPDRYFRAGLGDTIAKYFECHFSARGDELDYHSALGRAISLLCYERIQSYGCFAMDEKKRGVPGKAFTETTLAIVVNTGLVSHMVEDCYNCAVAHSVCYGLERLPGKNAGWLHGDLVAYGLLVQLMLDRDEEAFREVRKLCRALGLPVSLSELGGRLTRSGLQPVIEETLHGPDMEHIPYPVTEDMLYEAMRGVEAAEE